MVSSHTAPIPRTPSTPHASGDEGAAMIARQGALSMLVALPDFVFGAVYMTVLLGDGFSPALIGVEMMGSTLLSTVVEIPSGDLGDRFGQRRIATLGLAIWGLSLIVFPALHRDSPWLLFAVLLVWTVGQALYSGAPLALTVNAIARNHVKRRGLAIRVSMIAKWVGAAAGAAVSLVLLRPIGETRAIAASGALLVILAFWLRFGWPESRVSSTALQQHGMLSRLRSSWSCSLWPLLTVTAETSMLLSVMLFVWQPLVADDAHLPASANGVVLLAMTAIAAAGAWLARFHRERRIWDVVAALLFVGMTFVTMGLLHDPIVTYLALGMLEISTSYIATAIGTEYHMVFPDESRNLLSSVFSAAAGVAMGLSDFGFGLVWDSLGMNRALIVAGCCGLAFALIAVATSSWTRNLAQRHEHMHT